MPMVDPSLAPSPGLLQTEPCREEEEGPARLGVTPGPQADRLGVLPWTLGPVSPPTWEYG